MNLRHGWTRGSAWMTTCQLCEVHCHNNDQNEIIAFLSGSSLPCCGVWVLWGVSSWRSYFFSCQIKTISMRLKSHGARWWAVVAGVRSWVLWNFSCLPGDLSTLGCHMHSPVTGPGSHPLGLTDRQAAGPLLLSHGTPPWPLENHLHDPPVTPLIHRTQRLGTEVSVCGASWTHPLQTALAILRHSMHS